MLLLLVDYTLCQRICPLKEVLGDHKPENPAPARLLPVPVWALQAGGSLLGKGDSVKRLCGNLQVDISKACSLLGWVPPLSVNEGLRRAMSCRIKIKR